MYLIKIISLLIISTLLLTTLNASRTKENLIPNKEQEIIHLLQDKIKVLDRLIVEAKIYKTEYDPVIKKDFYNSYSAFVTKSVSNSEYINTNTDNTSSKKKNSTGYLNISSNKIGVPKTQFDSMENKRDILGIKMQLKRTSKTLYSSNMNFIHILEKKFKKGLKSVENKAHKKEILKIVDETYENKFESLSERIHTKHIKLISLLSVNGIGRTFSEMMDDDSKFKWAISSKIVIFEFYIKAGKFYKKKIHNSSIDLDNTFEDLLKKEAISPTDKPNYYEKDVSYNLRCLQTSKDVKYKGRICINYINVDKDRYFESGVFETRENNFLQVNKRLFNSLKELDTELKKSSQDYIKYLILKMNTPAKKIEINLEDGL